ncbi:type II secretion system protein GspM [Pseudomonas sp. sp1636]|uniref:type II secretion system protein GspM n=1 Tax=Pseudomonas sp. sp1636 TaxID=3036707 RepID=UPI0025A58FD5|nr:type II secretion system protein GspM [Pseudomonas sp. sp1636]MDM8348167.1 type II secretion system protein GspM [Pseudomonas sp. sp1636]
MNKWLQRWRGMAAREQWLAFAVGLVLCGMLYLLLIGDPLAARLAKQESSYQLADARRLEAEAGLAELQRKLASAPDIAYRSALLAASASREELIRRIDEGTAELVTPEKMQAVLEDLLRSQPRLRLVGLESFSDPVRLPAVGNAPQATGEAPAVAPVTLYRHGLRLQLQGGYFDLLTYLQAIQDSGWKLNWDSLDYRVGEAGPGRAQISLKLYTLSRQAGWVGV